MANTITINVLGNARGLNRTLSGAKGQLSGFEQAGVNVGNSIGRAFGKLARRVGVASAAVLGTALFKGGQRLIGIDQAQAKLRGLGHDADAVAGIMDNALGAVKGTAFGLDEAATIAASAVAAGIEPGQQLEKYLRLTADAATIAGTDLGEMGSIINKVTANGRAMTENLNQLQDRGIPILGWLADEFGVTTVEMSKMVTQGKVDAETFQRVLENNIGGAALESGKTLTGGFNNMMAALGRFGAMLLGPFVDSTKGAFGAVTEAIDTWAERALPYVEAFATWLQDVAMPALGEFARTAAERLTPALVAFGEFLRDVVLPGLGSLVGFLSQNSFWVGLVATVLGTLVGAWVAYSKVMQAVRAVQAAVNLVMAANPIGLVVIAVTALVAALVYAYHNSDTFRRVVDRAFRVVSNAAKAVVDWVRDVVRWFRELHVKATFYVRAARQAVSTAFNRMWSTISGFGRNVVAAIRNAFNSFTGNIRAGVQHALEWVRWFPQQALYVIATFGSRIWSAGWDLIMGLVRGITAAVGRAVQAVVNVGRSILSGIKGALGIRSPSREFERVGFDVVRGLANGLARLAGVRRAASGLAREVERSFGVPTLQMEASAALAATDGVSAGRTYNLTVNVAPGASPVETGRAIVRAIEAYERANGGRP